MRKSQLVKSNFILSAIILLSMIFFMGSDFKKTPGPVQLEDSDTFVFIGNSITHQCLYTQYVEDYYYTRYPAKRIHFHNAGVSGDVAADVIRRFGEDIAKYNPKYASVLIGMNDGRYTPFDNEIFETYKKGMIGIVDSLQKIGTAPILITPTMYDLRATLVYGGEFEPDVASKTHYNSTLPFYGAWALQVANERGLGFINMFEPLNRISRENRKNNPEFTLIKDSIHPGEDGHVVMALAFLKDIGADPVVSSIQIDVQNNEWEILEAENGNFEKLGGDQIKFNFTSNSLPWVLPEDAALGYKLTNAGELMSREIVKVTGLSKGEYDLLIDGNSVGKYSHLNFANGVELQENKLTPQYQQAAKVALLNKTRNKEAVSPMRDLWLMRKIITAFHESPEDIGDEEEKQWFEQYLIENFGSTDIDKFIKQFDGKLTPLQENAKVMEDEIYEMNKPAAHTYEIIKRTPYKSG